MAKKRQPKPFYKKSHDAWYVQVHGKQYRLGKEYDDDAERKYHAALSIKPVEKPKRVELTVAILIDDFLSAMKVKVRQKKLAQRTYDWYDLHLQSFATFVKTRLKVSELKPLHVQNWLDKDYADAGENYRLNGVRAVSRVFNWAKKLGTIPGNPILGVERPTYEPRECYLTHDQWKQVVALLKADDPFTDLVWFLYLTGARPHEARTAKDWHYDRETKSLVFERRNSKGKKSRRVILLEGKALDIVERRATGGYIFTNTDGTPWTSDALNCRFKRLRSSHRKAVVEKLSEKLGKKPTREQIDAELFEVFPYIFRHTFITNALKRGLNPLTVAALAGHKNARMVIEVYGHLCQDSDHLRQELRRAIA